MSLFDNPNPLMTRNEFIQACAGYIALYGEVAIIKTKSMGQAAGTRNIPAELWPVNPSSMTEVTSGNKITGWKYNAQSFTADEVIFIKDFNPYSELIPGKTVSCAAVTKERKALGLMLPRGLKAKKTSPTKSLVKPWGKRKAKAEKTTSTSLDLTFMGNVKDMVESLKDQKVKIDAAIAALEALTKEAL